MAETEAKNERGGSYNGKHWSQSPEGRKKMSQIQKKRFAKSRRVKRATHTERKNASSNGTTAAEATLDEGTFGYALGYIESWLGTYAAAAGVPASSLAARVGKVLHSKARG